MSAPLFWQKRNFFAATLLPWAGFYLLGRLVHKWWRTRQRVHLNVPVISVGNLTAGGAGKTPVVQALAKHFTQHGHIVAVLSRGYGGKTETARLVKETHTPLQVGDEPMEIFHAKVAAQVWVGPDRRETARRAVADGATLLILDDGFQYDALYRDVDLLVVDGATGLGNRWPLPAGPLRDLPSAGCRADGVIMVGDGQAPLPKNWHMSRFDLSFAPPPPALLQTPLVAFAGLGRPSKFFDALLQHRAHVMATVPFPDHHFYTADDETYLADLAQHHNATLATTAKDAVKLSPGFRHQVAVVPITFTPEKLARLTSWLDSLLAARER